MVFRRDVPTCPYGEEGVGNVWYSSFWQGSSGLELIYTPHGSKKIGFADIGDIIYGDDGKLTTIVGVYPQGFVDTYKVTFEDGQRGVLWEARVESQVSW